MKKLFGLIFLGMLVFVGGQWIGLEMQARQKALGNASVPVLSPEEAPIQIDPLKPAPPLAPVK